MERIQINTAALMIFLVASGLTACGDKATYMYGLDLDQWTFQLYSTSMGIHPDQSVLQDPNNPFAYAAPDSKREGDKPTQVDKWMIDDLFGPPVAFYSWATWLVHQPTGEHQYYTGLALKGVYLGRHVENQYLEDVKQMAIQAFHAVLDHFPHSVTYNATGTIAWPLAPLAYEEIIELSGSAQGVTNGSRGVLPLPETGQEYGP